MPRTEIRVGDAFDPDVTDPQSVDLIVTSPPYYSFRDYSIDTDHQFGGEEHPWQYLELLWAWMENMRRVVKPSGSVFVVIGDKYAGSGGHNNRNIGGTEERGPKRYSQSSYVWPNKAVTRKSRMGIPWQFASGMVLNGWVLRSEIIWSKPNPIPTNARDRAEFTHEYIFHFTMSPDHYASPDLPRYPSVWEITASEGFRYPKDRQKHFAPFPAEIVRRVVSGWCPPDGLVFDPFAGTGTTALVSKILGVNSLSVDLSPTYVKLARWRVFASDHRARLEERWRNQGLI